MTPRKEQYAADFLRLMLYHAERNSGRVAISKPGQEAIITAIIALERQKRAKRAETVGRLFKQWLCPSCFTTP